MSEDTDRELRAALDLHGRGRYDEAIAIYRALAERAPHDARVLHMLGVALHQSGCSAEARDVLDRAVALAPDDVRLRVNRAGALLALHEEDAAERDARFALERQPQDFGARLNLALALEAQGRYVEAQAAFAATLALRADDPKSQVGLARSALRNGKAAIADALTMLARARDADVRLVRGQLLQDLGELDRAEAEWKALVAHATVGEIARLRLARLAIERGRATEGIAMLDELIAENPAHREAGLLRAAALTSRGPLEAGLADYERYLDLVRDYPQAESNYLIALQNAPETTPQRLLEAHRRWAERHAPAAESMPVRGHGNRKPRIGWISPRFLRGPVQTFFAPVLKALRRRGDATHALVMTSTAADEATAEFRHDADEWLDADGWNEPRLLRRLRELDLDLAVDLSGHAPGGSLRVFARRIAPVQASWLDYFATTGVAAIDVLIGDDFLTPPGSEPDYTERIVRLHPSRLCYGPPDFAEALPPSSGDVRELVSFNRLSKLNEATFDVWASILRALPDWRLRLRGLALADADARRRVVSTFEARGVEASRIGLDPFGSYRDVMASYRSAAIALDTFPFSGCATTCDALWMGVPVVTRTGRTLVSRQSGALLHALGLDELIANSADDYARCVIDLAENSDRRRALGAGLRERMRAALCDADRFAERLMAILGELIDASRRVR